MSDRNFFLHDRDTNRFTNGVEVTIFSHVHSAEDFIPKISRQSLRTYWAIFSIWDIASVAHFLTLSSYKLYSINQINKFCLLVSLHVCMFAAP